jgi:ice-binding like protein
MNHAYKNATLKAAVALAVLLCIPSLGFAQVGLGMAASYTVLAGSTITNTGATKITGDVGLSPGTAITGLPVGQPSGGAVHAGDAAAAQAKVDLGLAYIFLAGMPCGATMSGVDLGGQALGPGVYCFAAAAGLTGTLHLDAQGDTSAVFVFQIGSALTVAGNSKVILDNGAQIRHVWWKVGSSATLGIGSAMQGNVLAGASITLVTGASLAGRAMAAAGAVTLDTNILIGIGHTVTPTSRTSWSKVKAQYR